MRFVSTSNPRVTASLAEAVARPIAGDGGIYMPETIPTIPQALFNNIEDMNLREIAYVVATSFLGMDVAPADLKAAVDYAFNVDAPLIELDTNLFVLELFHGPTLTCKDFGARFMSRLMGVVVPDSPRTVMVATTGNTGSAIANGFLGREGINVVVLYPKGRLSRSQIAEMTSLGGNVYPVEVAGSVEDCKRLLQQAIADPELERFNITGANSINVARLIPQIAYAMQAYARLREMRVPNAENAVFSIPAGNLSNVVATVMAKRAGMPVSKIIGATNSNNALGKMLRGAECSRYPLHTLAPSIDMAYPSGWPRLESIFKNRDDIAEEISAVAADNEQITEAVLEARNKYGYTLDPHGAAAYHAVRGIQDVPRVVFATGHPAKQLNIMTKITGAALELPLQLTRFMNIQRQPSRIAPTLPALRKLMNSIT